MGQGVKRSGNKIVLYTETASIEVLAVETPVNNIIILHLAVQNSIGQAECAGAVTVRLKRDDCSPSKDDVPITFSSKWIRHPQSHNGFAGGRAAQQTAPMRKQQRAIPKNGTTPSAPTRRRQDTSHSRRHGDMLLCRNRNLCAEHEIQCVVQGTDSPLGSALATVRQAA